LKSGTCPKCASRAVFSGASIPLKKGPFGSNSIPISLTSVAALDNYVCSECGYVESYVSHSERLAEIAKKWVQVKDAATATDTADKE
jgi:predicted nucleic-acid-binding Zn-ribbon protein